MSRFAPSSLARSVPFLLALAAPACSAGSSSQTTPESGADSSSQATPGSGDPMCANGGSHVIAAIDYAASCTTDDDCVGVPFGGDVCTACSDREYFVCSTALSSTRAAEYLAALDKALGTKAGETFGESCPGTPYGVSCPAGRPRCSGNMCILAP
ncbi:MAG TPA: hypothetical protein VGI39_20095 [Polyangiaceae bacterium]|jgi:hypothetical protein